MSNDNITDLDKFRKSKQAAAEPQLGWFNVPSEQFLKSADRAAEQEARQAEQFLKSADRAADQEARQAFRPAVGLIEDGVSGDPLSEITLRHYAAGFKTRSDYFVWLAKRYNTTPEAIATIAIALGTKYDFDRLLDYFDTK